jgi:hypothetical protein
MLGIGTLFASLFAAIAEFFSGQFLDFLTGFLGSSPA